MASTKHVVTQQDAMLPS